MDLIPDRAVHTCLISALPSLTPPSSEHSDFASKELISVLPSQAEMDSGLGRSCPGLEAGLCTKGGKDSQQLESFIPFWVPGRHVLTEGLQRAVVSLSRAPGQCLLPSTPPSLVVHSSSKAWLCPLYMPYPPGTGRRCESPHHWLLVLWVTEDSTWWGQLGKRGCPGSGSWGIWAPRSEELEATEDSLGAQWSGVAMEIRV